MGLRGIVFWIILFCASSFCVSAQEGDVWNIPLDSVVVKSHRHNLALSSIEGGILRWDMSQMHSLPKLLGSADPLRYAQMLPGFQTNNEYDSGIYVQGCANQHNALSINGVPLYNVSHLLGFFSSFISSHYRSMLLTKSPSSSAMSNRLGAGLDMDSQEEPSDESSGEFSVGLISSQGTYRWAISPKTMLKVSLRGSYMKFLYGRWLKVDGEQMDYSFFDSNATLIHHYDDENCLMLDFYSGEDRLSVFENNYMADMGIKWGNAMGAAHWHHVGKNGLRALATMYVTSFRNHFNLLLENMRFDLRSSIIDAGLKGQVEKGHWSGGFEVLWHWVKPQSLERRGSYNETDGTMMRQRGVESSLFADYSQPLFANTSALIGLRGSAYGGTGKFYCAIDPFSAISYDDLTTRVTFSYSRKHQYLFLTGFSDIGLPTEFWMSCDAEFGPQETDILNLSVSRYLFRRGYQVSLDLFYRRLKHQVEYSGTVLDFMNTDYDINSLLKQGKGNNCGFSVMLSKNSGKLTGWLNYSYLHARRTFEHLVESGSFNASHSRPHEVNVVMTYNLNRHWDFSGTMTLASGTPYTAAESLLLINGNVVVDYGEYNAKRLRSYFRTDVSVNYKWKSRWFNENGVNLSVYNVTNHRNELYHYLRTNNQGQYAYRPVSSVMRLLPSISYYCKF